jgi:hypothetical protein
VPDVRANRLPLIVGATIFIVALLLRLMGLGWGLKNDLHNQSYHPDEPVIFGYSQRIEPAKGQFVPGFYNYGTLYLTILRVASDVVTGYTGGPDKTDDSYWSWVSRCHEAGRFISAVAGAGTALLLFGMMKRYTSLWGAALAGALIAFAPAHVVHSRFQTVDVVAAFFIAASAYAALRMLPRTEPPDEASAETTEEGPSSLAITDKAALKLACWSGVFAGLSAGTKYTGGLAILTLYAVLILAKRKRWFMEAVIGTVAMICTFVVTTPGCVMDTEKFIADIQFESQHVAEGHGFAFMGTPSGFVFHIFNLGMGIGWLMFLVALAGLVWAVVKKQTWAIALLAFFIPYYILIAKAEVKFIRYTFPLYVGLAAGFGWGMAEAHRRKGLGRIAVAVGICGLGGLDYGGLRASATMTAQMGFAEDSRDIAARYIRQIATPLTRVGFARDSWYWSIPLEPDSALPPSEPWAARLQKLQTESKPPVDLVLDSSGFPTTFDPNLISKLHPELIAFTSIEAGDLMRLQSDKSLTNAEQGEIAGPGVFFKQLPESYSQKMVFGTAGLPVEDMQYVDPIVWIWQRKGTP